MMDLSCIPLHLDVNKRTCRAIIETPKGSRNKFRYDRKTRLFMLGGILPEGMIFPFDFGFLPSTLGEDGDPLDIMVMLEAPAQMGCLLEVRLIGVIKAIQTEKKVSKRNDRLLGTAIHSHEHGHLESITDISSPLLSQIEEFFVSYNKQRGKQFQIKDVEGPKKAIKFVKLGIQSLQKAQKEVDEE